VIRKGDTLSAIAQRFGVSLAALERANPSINPDRLTIGTKIIIPSTRAAQPTATATSAAGSAPAKKVYIVQPGDTLTRIAIQFGVTEAALVAANPGLNPDQIAVGQRLVIPGGSPVPSATVTPSPSPKTALYPAPVLVGPANGTSITGKNQEITLRWTWSRSLESAEWFEVQMWKSGESPQGRVWTKQTSWLIGKTLYPGNYSWRIVVVRQQSDGTGQAVSNPSTEWLVKWN
jgi:LysM repeat protein